MPPPHVLIVDDDGDIRDVIGMVLQEDGFTTSLCATIAQAVTILESQVVHLLITDRRLTDGDGLDLIRYLAGRSDLATRIILLTAARPAVSPDEHPLIVRASVRIISKPFDIDQIIGDARLLTGWPGAQGG
jgi:two-component system, NtrC family, response regulator PilR